MNLTETAALLTLIASYDRRTIGEADVRAWHEILDDVPAADARAAVLAYYRRTREWIMPADIRGHFDDLRADRARRFAGKDGRTVEELVQADPSDQAAYRTELAELRRKVAIGEITRDDLPPALERGRS